MKRALLVTERTVTFPVFIPGGTAGTVYNGVILSSTVTGPALPDATVEGKGIDCSNYYRALVIVTCGTIAGDNTISALVGPKGYAADDAAPNEAVSVPSFLLNIGSGNSGETIVGEIFLQAVVGNPLGTKGANSLWIKKTGTDQELSVVVVLEDPATEIAAGRNTLQDAAVYTG